LKGILLDENIPKRASFVTILPVYHATDLGQSASDSAIWQHARDNELVIVTKDADFSHRIMLAKPPPWVVHLRFGNMRKNDYVTRLAQLWPQVEMLLPGHKLINVFSDSIEAIQD